MRHPAFRVYIINPQGNWKVKIVRAPDRIDAIWTVLSTYSLRSVISCERAPDWD